MINKNSDNGHDILTETQFLLYLIKYIITFPFLLILFVFGKKNLKELFIIYYITKNFFKDAIVTYNLIRLNILIFIFQIFILYPNNLMDFLIISPENFYSGNVISLISHMFLHGSIMHLLGNMLFLFIFGRIVEKHLGRKQMLIVYFGAGIIAGMVASGIFYQSGLGASAAISGLVAAAILIRPFYISYIAIIPLPIFILGILQIFGDFTGLLYPDQESNIGHLAHLTGYASIMITVFLLNKEERKKMFYGLLINLIIITLFLGLYFR